MRRFISFGYAIFFLITFAAAASRAADTPALAPVAAPVSRPAGDPRAIATPDATAAENSKTPAAKKLPPMTIVITPTRMDCSSR
jgi:hypothetical protein